MKKGFTLIELLATIVILSIIALITVPIVNKVINTGKVSALENSTTFYIKDLEKQYSEWSIEGIPDDINVIKSTEYDIFDVKEINEILDLDGTVPNSGTLNINNNYNSNNYGSVISAYLEYEGNYKVNYTYDGKTIDIKVDKK